MVKRYCVESGSNWFIELVRNNHGESWYELFIDGKWFEDGFTIEELKEIVKTQA